MDKMIQSKKLSRSLEVVTGIGIQTVIKRNSSIDKSADQSGSFLSKSANVKENDKGNQFLSSICTVLPLIVQLISDDVNPKYIDTTFKLQLETFGGMKLEAVEMIRIITSKF